MKAKDFEWEDIGKKTPYSIPPSFFADSEEKILINLRLKTHRKKGWLMRIVWSSAAMAAILAVVLTFSIFRQNDTREDVAIPAIYASASLQMELLEMEEGLDTPTEMDELIENLSDEELTELAIQANSDIFLH